MASAEPMEIDRPDDMSQDEDEALIVLSLKWITPHEPQKVKRLEARLQIMLQTWFSKCKHKVDCSVERTLKDGRVVIKTKPVPVLTELQKLSKETLTGREGNSVTITSISLTLPSPELDTQVPEDASVTLPPSMPESQIDQVQLGKQSNAGSAGGEQTGAAKDASTNHAPFVTAPQTEHIQPGNKSNTGSTAGEDSGFSPMSETQTDQLQLGKQSSTVSAGEKMCTCSVPVGHFCYVTHMYEEEMKLIEKKNGVKIMAEVKVRFEVDQKHGRPDNALDEFANLVQKSLAESCGSVIPLKFIESDQWGDALKTIQKKESKLLVTLTSDVMTVRGPGQSQDVISKCLYADAMQTTNTHGSLAQFYDQVQVGKQRSTVSAGEEMSTCSVPVGHFCYVTHMYEEEMKLIEKKNGVKIMADVKVRFEVDQKHGRPDNALDEFANLVQKSLGESSGSVIPLKFIESDQWGDALKTIQEKENKLLVTLTSETMTVRGPTQSQEAIKKFLNADTEKKRNTDASHEENERETQDTSLKIDMTTKDHLMHMGLTMEESYWKVMITSYSDKVTRIKDKFNVELKESDIGQGKVNVKAVYKRDEGNASMESHAVRELFHLYQKTATSPMNFSQSSSGMWSFSWLWQ